MSDTSAADASRHIDPLRGSIPVQHESAVAILRDRERVLDAEIGVHTRRVEILTERRDELLDLIATMTRKPRVRKARVATEAAPDTADDAPRPNVFALPANDAAGETEAA